MNLDKSIARKNQAWEKVRVPYRLGTIVKGELYKWAIDASNSCWPSELGDLRTLLELHLDDGKGMLPKEKIARLLEAIHEKSSNKEEAKRACASTALLLSVAIQNYTENDNHVAEIEAWVMAMAYTLREAERHHLKKSYWQSSFNLMWMACENAFERLLDELMEREHHAEGSIFGEPDVRGARFTILVGLLSAYGLKKRINGFSVEPRERFVLDWVHKHISKMLLWGESSTPYFLSRYWFFGEYNRDYLGSLIATFSSRNSNTSVQSLSNPYMEFEEVILDGLKSSNDSKKTKTNKCKGTGNSWMLEGLVYLYTRLNWKVTMRSLWPSVSRITQMSFIPDEQYDLFKWRTDKGINLQVIPKRLQKWKGLKDEAAKSDDNWIPESIRHDPAILLLILIVYPHRMNSKMMRWLDSAFINNG